MLGIGFRQKANCDELSKRCSVFNTNLGVVGGQGCREICNEFPPACGTRKQKRVRGEKKVTRWTKADYRSALEASWREPVAPQSAVSHPSSGGRERLTRSLVKKLGGGSKKEMRWSMNADVKKVLTLEGEVPRKKKRRGR